MAREEAIRLGHPGLPLYLQLSEILREKIAAGEYTRGSALPSETSICEAFGVSRITVRAALRILVDEGLIVRRSGKGTHVRQDLANGAYLAASSIRDLLYGGHEAETRREYLGGEFETPDPETAKDLHISRKKQVFKTTSVMYVSEIPFSYMTIFIPAVLGRRLPQDRLAEMPTILLLSEVCNIQIAEVDQWTTASHADSTMAPVLRIQQGDPVLVVKRIFFSLEKVPVELSKVFYRSDRFHQHVRLYRADVRPKGTGRIALDLATVAGENSP